MRWLALLAALIGFAGQTPAARYAMQVLIGTPPHPVVSGEIWMIANRWGAYPAVLAATIKDGRLEPLEPIQFPNYWKQAFSYKVLVAVSSTPTEPPQAAYHDFGYETVGRPGYLKTFPVLYLSPRLAPQQLGRNWREALDEIGRHGGGILILPPPERRTIRLEYPDGRPLAGRYVRVSLYGSRRNHCGVVVGIDLGGFKTNSRGQISVVATHSALAISASGGYFGESKGGPAGTTFTAESAVTVGGEPHITLERLWSLPKYRYAITARSAGGGRVTLRRVEACENVDGCGAGCGPLYTPPRAISSGTVRFRSQDLREMRSITLVDTAGQKRTLTQAEMRQLLTRHLVRVVW